METEYYSKSINEIEEYSGVDNLISILISAGIIFSWCSLVIVALSIGSTASEDFLDPGSKPAIYYLLHGTGMAALIGGGILAGIKGQYQKLSRPMRFAFWLLMTTSMTWSFIAYDFKDVSSMEVFGATGPFVWFSCVLIFAGMNRSVWRMLEPVILVLAYLTALLAIHSIVTSSVTVEERWLSAPVRYMILLMWFGGWALLTSHESKGLALLLRFLPYLVFILTTIYTQTRSWFLMSLLLLTFYWFVGKRYDENHSRVMGKFLFFSGIMLIAALVSSIFLEEYVSNSIIEFRNRAFEDSRTGQFVDFFSQVSISDLIFGMGPKSTWYWGGKDYQFIDNAYLWMAFIGGIPIVLSYCMLIIYPGFRAYFAGATNNDAAAASLIILWCLSLTGFSTYLNPSLTPHSYLLLLLSGRCLAYLDENFCYNDT
ncbi:MAG: hypothetical protein EG822_12745 [Deltaproteobacteria bacterium]|nr:hypothetical protein [Deltaproteobacteria bacterium]TLN00238.1 MAG: hypothetical protein FDZ73_20035 [bacterium]